MGLDSPVLQAESALRMEGIDDLLIMDWWFDTEMAKERKPAPLKPSVHPKPNF